jgi:nucleoid DNA-binding protein
MAKKSKKKEEQEKETKLQTVSHLEVAREIAKKLRWPTINDILEIINAEQEVTINFLKKGKRVIKRNYLILTPRELPGKELHSPLSGKTHVVPPKKTVSVRLGKKLKDSLN